MKIKKGFSRPTCNGKIGIHPVGGGGGGGGGAPTVGGKDPFWAIAGEKSW